MRWEVDPMAEVAVLRQGLVAGRGSVQERVAESQEEAEAPLRGPVVQQVEAASPLRVAWVAALAVCLLPGVDL